MKCLLIFFFLTINLSPIMTSDEISQLINRVKNDLAPDKRTAVFNIEFKLEGNNLNLFGEVSDVNFKSVLFENLKSSFNYHINDEITLLPDSKLGKNHFGVVKISVANIRSKPEHPAELSTQAILGTPVNVLKSQGGWYYIQTPDSYLGWVDHDGIELMNSDEVNAWKKKEKLIYTEVYGLIEELNKPSIVSDVVCGAILVYSGEVENYFIVEFPDGRKGKIEKRFVSKFENWSANHNFSSEKVINSAKKMIGFPYLWGGTSIKGLDCSGFTKTAFFLNGIVLPRDANQQAMIGEDVPYDEEFSKLIPGDLIFFGRRNSATQFERITHVGIYLGEKLFIHSSGRVRIDSFDKSDPNYNEYRRSTILRVKRILTPDQIEKLKIMNNKFYAD
ncbi:MAG: NlpC/P60 family protein [Ignavibacteria bacterium]|nr:NlpC/P60 family protein [Ignavibacteria bacterium]